MIRTRIPGRDDARLLRIIMHRLMPVAREARPDVKLERREILKRWKNCRVYVACLPGRRPHGFISCKLVGETLTIDMLAVEKQTEGQGIGSALMSVAENYARRRGASAVRLAVDEPNAHAQRFYRSKGYETEIYLEEHRIYIMSKRL